MTILAKPGDTLFFGPYAAHASFENTSAMYRRVLINGYAYPGANDLNYPEIYGGGTYYGGEEKWDLGAKLWAGWDWFGYDAYGYYAETNFNYALPWWEIGVTAHLGYTFGDGPDGFTEDSGLREYVDYWLGINRSFGPVDLELRYVDTDLGEGLEVSGDAGTNDDRFIFSISTTLPW